MESKLHAHWYKWKAFPLRTCKKQICLLSPVLFNILLEVMSTAGNRKKKCSKISQEYMTISYIFGNFNTLLKVNL